MRRAIAVFIVALSLIPLAALEGYAADPVVSRAHEVQRLCEEISSIDAAIERIEQERVSLEGRLAGLDLEIASTERELERLRREIAVRERAVSRRARQLYLESDADTLLFLLSARDFVSLVDRVRIMAVVVEAEGENLLRLAEAKRDLEAAGRRLREDHAKRAAYLLARKEEEVRLQALLAARRAALARASRELVALLAPRRAAAAARVTASRGSGREGSGPSYGTSSDVPMKLAEVLPYGGGWLTSARMPSRYEATGSRWTCYASWYGNEFHGRRTASGEVFNQWDFTCAHRSLPFGTFVAIEYRGRRIVAMVTDRGPFIAGREFDLSRGCAQALGYSGVAKVTVEIVAPVR